MNRMNYSNTWISGRGRLLKQSAALLLFLLAACGAARADAPIYLSGRALVTGTNAPAPGVTVSIYAPGQDSPVDITQTLQNGSYILKAPHAGRYRLTAAGGVYDDFSKRVDVPAAGLSSFKLQLRHLPSVRLRLLDAAGKPVSAAGAQGWVWIYRKMRQGRRNDNHRHQRRRPGAAVLALTVDQNVGPDGLLEMTLPRDIESMNVDKILIGVRGPRDGCGQRQIDDWPDAPLSIKLSPGATLKGLVRDRDGNPAAGVSIVLTPRVEHAWVRVRRGFATRLSDPTGHFQIAALPPGMYRVMARAPDGRRYSDDVTLDGGQTRITMDPSRG